MSGLLPKIKQRWRALRTGVKRASATFGDEWSIRYDVAASLRLKNVARYLPEWIEFHLMVGVEHFFLYDNGSTDDCRAALEPYIREGLVTLHHWPQVPAFPASHIHCIEHYGRLCRWIAFLDDDEFLFPVRGGSLRQALKRFEAFPAVAVHWVMFGSSGHKARPEGLVISNYKLCKGGPDRTIKSIVNPRRIRAAKSPHYWIYKDHARSVNERYEPVRNSCGVESPTVDVLRINHYWSKSYEDGVVKMTRGGADPWSLQNPRTMDTWLEDDLKYNQAEDTLILRYEKQLQERLAKRFPNQPA